MNILYEMRTTLAESWLVLMIWHLDYLFNDSSGSLSVGAASRLFGRLDLLYHDYLRLWLSILEENCLFLCVNIGHCLRLCLDNGSKLRNLL